MLEVKVILESNIALGAECRTFEIGVRIRVNVRLELSVVHTVMVMVRVI